jgi:hypothetical protein
VSPFIALWCCIGILALVCGILGTALWRERRKHMLGDQAQELALANLERIRKNADADIERLQLELERRLQDAQDKAESINGNLAAYLRSRGAGSGD